MQEEIEIMGFGRMDQSGSLDLTVPHNINELRPLWDVRNATWRWQQEYLAATQAMFHTIEGVARQHKPRSRLR